MKHILPNDRQRIITILYLLHGGDLSVSCRQLCPSVSPPRFLSDLRNLYPWHLYELLLISVFHDPNGWGRKQQTLFLYATLCLFCWINWRNSQKAKAQFKNPLLFWEIHYNFDNRNAQSNNTSILPQELTLYSSWRTLSNKNASNITD